MLHKAWSCNAVQTKCLRGDASRFVCEPLKLNWAGAAWPKIFWTEGEKQSISLGLDGGICFD